MEKAEVVKILRGISEEAYNTASGAGCRALGAKVAEMADKLEAREVAVAPATEAVEEPEPRKKTTKG